MRGSDRSKAAIRSRMRSLSDQYHQPIRSSGAPGEEAANAPAWPSVRRSAIAASTTTAIQASAEATLPGEAVTASELELDPDAQRFRVTAPHQRASIPTTAPVSAHATPIMTRPPR